MKALLSTVALSVVIFQSVDALACSCLGIANAQQAAQGENAIVAKVRTLTLSPDGTGQLEIETVYKGAPGQQTITVTGGDGANCHGPILETHDSWVVILEQHEGTFGTATCADSSLQIDPETNRIQVVLGEEIALTEDEFIDVIDYKVQPTAKSLSCSLSANRYYFPYDSKEAEKYQFSFWETAKPGPTPFSASLDVDLSTKGFRLSRLQFDAQASKTGPTTYEVAAALVEPFFSTRVSLPNGTIDMRRLYLAEFKSGFERYTDPEGREVEPKTYPYLYHSVYPECHLDVGLPLVPVE